MVTYVKYVVNGGVMALRPDFTGCLGCLVGCDLHPILCKTLEGGLWKEDNSGLVQELSISKQI